MQLTKNVECVTLARIEHMVYGNLTGRTCDEGGNCVADDSGEFKELNYRQQGAHFWGLEG